MEGASGPRAAATCDNDPQLRTWGWRAFAARWNRPIALGLSALLALFGIFVIWILATDPRFAHSWGADRAIYEAATREWLATGAFYHPHQLAGPYELSVGDILYPPIALLLFVPAMALPALLWWMVPLGIIAAVVAHQRPHWWAWPIIIACFVYPKTLELGMAGNPVMWASAAVALGTMWAGAAVMVLFKPTLAPFALLGANRRSWWIALAAFVALCIPFGRMWPDWIQAVTNVQGERVGPLYSYLDIGWMLGPIVAWVGGRRLGMFGGQSATLRPWSRDRRDW